MSVIRIRGLPFSARSDDILDFFKDVRIKGGKRGIYFPQGTNGRSNGEAFIELESPSETKKAAAHHNEHMGRRYIEVFPSSFRELENAMGRRYDSYHDNEYVVRLRGLPYDTEKKEIYAFFNGLEIAPNGIGLLVDHMGRCTGEAYVQFTSAESLSRAKEKHMEKIGHRYIEIFESTMTEANLTIRRQMEVNQDRSYGGPVHGRSSRDLYPPYGNPKAFGEWNSFSACAPSYYRGPPGRYAPYGRPHPEYNSPSRVSVGGPMCMLGSNPKYSGYGPSLSPEPDEPQSLTGHSIRMRGLPFSATNEDIEKFLSPLQPVSICICFNSAGRPSGEAVVDFASHDEAKEAMKKDREKIGSRYIELFLASTPRGILRPHRGSGSFQPTMYSAGRMTEPHSPRPYGHSNYGDAVPYDHEDYEDSNIRYRSREFDALEYPINTDYESHFNGRSSSGYGYSSHRSYRHDPYPW